MSEPRATSGLGPWCEAPVRREPRVTAETPGPSKPLYEIETPEEALHFALARCTYHAQRHPDLRFTDHIADYIERALDLLSEAANSQARPE